MTRDLSISKFFESKLGAPLRNARWSWGAFNPTTKDLFLRVWNDEHQVIDGRHYVMLMGPKWKSPGVHERHQQINAIRGGALTYAVFCTASDPTSGTRSIESFDPSTLGRINSVIDVNGAVYGEITEFVDIADTSLAIRNGSASRWTNDELKACVDAYSEMLSAEKRGDSYSKSAFNKRLREDALSRRSKSSIEYRLRNISTVLEDFGLQWIKGYRPARNLGAGTRIILIDLLGLRDFEASMDHHILEQRSAALKKVSFSSAPKGNERPSKSTVSSASFLRSPAVRAFVLQVARGKCELCGRDAPFLDRSNEPFLEVHHVVPLTEGGPDTTCNAVGLCPNCHRRCHYSKDHVNVRTELYQTVQRLKRPNAEAQIPVLFNG